jgi:hypothetical protein
MKINVTPGKVRNLLQSLGRITITGKILANELTEEEIKAIADLFQPWKTGEAVELKVLRKYNGELYECIQAHTTQSDWTPDAPPALWRIKSAPGVIPEWSQPESANPYMLGDKVTYGGRIYESTIDNNVWSPDALPSGWTDLGPI